MSLLDDLKALISKHAKEDVNPSELEARHAVCVAIADHEALPAGARWENNGVMFQCVKNGELVWGYISFFNILDAVIDRRIERWRRDVARQ